MSQSKRQPGFISDADFEKTIGVADARPAGFISDEEFNQNIGVAPEQEDGVWTAAGKNLVGGVSALGKGAVEGALDLGRGVEQLYLSGAEKIGIAKKGSSESYRKKINELKQKHRESKSYQEHPLMSTIGEVAGGIIPLLPTGALSIPARGAAAAKNVGALAKVKDAVTSNAARTVGTGALQGAAAGGLQYDPTGEGRLSNLMTGAVLGAAVPGTFLAGRRALRGKDASEATALSKEHGIDLTVPELRGSVTGKYIESVAEKIPLSGYVPFREKQLGQFEQRAKSLVEKIGGKAESNFNETARSGTQAILQKNKKETGKLFDKVDELANSAQYKDKKVDFTNLELTAQNALQELNAIPPQFLDKELVKNLERFAGLKPESFNSARILRTKLGDEVSQLKKSANSGAAQAGQYRVASQLFDALEKDLDYFAEKTGGKLKDVYAQARATYRDKVVPFKKGQLAKTVSDDYDVDLTLGAFLKPNRPQLASQLLDNTTGKGVTAARASVLNEAMERATQSGQFSPMRFASEALRLGKTNNVLFSKEQLNSLKGYEKLSKIADRASKFALNPETGARNVGLLGTGLAVASLITEPVTAGITLLGGLGSAKLMTSDAGRKLLTRAKNLPEKSSPKKWQKLLLDAGKLLAPVAATQPTNIPENGIE